MPNLNLEFSEEEYWMLNNKRRAKESREKRVLTWKEFILERFGL